jgi:Carboxylesterase family
VRPGLSKNQRFSAGVIFSDSDIKTPNGRREDSLKENEQGLLSGTAGNNPDVRVYKGIPFAAPPVGEIA